MVTPDCFVSPARDVLFRRDDVMTRHSCGDVYARGGEDNLRAARKYYAAAVDMSNATDARALYGLLLVDAKLKKFGGKRGGGGGGGRTDAGDDDGLGGSELSTSAGTFLRKLYGLANKGLLPVVEKMLNK